MGEMEQYAYPLGPYRRSPYVCPGCGHNVRTCECAGAWPATIDPTTSRVVIDADEFEEAGRDPRLAETNRRADEYLARLRAEGRVHDA